MRDDQLQRYARHVQLDGIGRAGQDAVLAAAARVDGSDRAARIAATFLAAGGVGTLQLDGAADGAAGAIAARGPDTHVVNDGAVAGAPVALDPTPTWWPTAGGDAEALAYWRGGLAAARWLAETARR